MENSSSRGSQGSGQHLLDGVPQTCQPRVWTLQSSTPAGTHRQSVNQELEGGLRPAVRLPTATAARIVLQQNHAEGEKE